MPINEAPVFPDTLVSALLAKPWTDSALEEELRVNAVKGEDLHNVDYLTANLAYHNMLGFIINNAGRRLELRIIDPEAKSKILANGIVIGNETVMFRPYKGVFALLRNVPLEVDAEGVYRLITNWGWKITGPRPIARISAQKFIRRDGTTIDSGKWVCMLDEYPKLKVDNYGNPNFTARAYGGRTVSFIVCFDTPPKRMPIGQGAVDPHNYTQKQHPQIPHKHSGAPTHQNVPHVGQLPNKSTPQQCSLKTDPVKVDNRRRPDGTASPKDKIQDPDKTQGELNSGKRGKSLAKSADKPREAKETQVNDKASPTVNPKRNLQRNKMGRPPQQ